MCKVLSIIVPSYNVESYSQEVLPTYIQPKLSDKLEVIIVNDGSEDDTKRIAESFYSKVPDVFRVINKDNGGHGSAINAGIKSAEGQYIRVIDGDDYVDNTSLIRFIEKLEKMDADIILTPFNYVDTSNKIMRVSPKLKELNENTVYELNDVVDQISDLYTMHSLTIKRDILKKIPLISEKCFYVDNEFIVYPIKYADTIAFINETVYQYRIGTTGQSISIKNLQKNASQHLQVCNNLISYTKDVNIKGKKANLIRRICRRMIHSQIEIYLTMNISRKNAEKLKEFILNVNRNASWAFEKNAYWQDYLVNKQNVFGYLIAACITNIRVWMIYNKSKYEKQKNNN